jgi:hypothetical protein
MLGKESKKYLRNYHIDLFNKVPSTMAARIPSYRLVILQSKVTPFALSNQPSPLILVGNKIWRCHLTYPLRQSTLGKAALKNLALTALWRSLTTSQTSTRGGSMKIDKCVWKHSKSHYHIMRYMCSWILWTCIFRLQLKNGYFAGEWLNYVGFYALFDGVWLQGKLYPHVLIMRNYYYWTNPQHTPLPLPHHHSTTK